MAVTIKMIAEATGLSNQTVSGVLGERAHLFRPETRDMVREAAQRLGYRPNASARAMRSGRSNAIALLLSTEPGRSSLFSHFLQGAESVVHAAGMHLIVTALPDDKLTDPEFVPKILREYMTDGLLINYFQRIPAALEDLIERNLVPAVWTNARRASDCVFPDDYATSLEETRNLIRQGHRRIGYADCVHDHPLDKSVEHYSAMDRQDGYREAMREAGLPLCECLPARVRHGVEVVREVRDWLSGSQRPTAVVTYCDVEVNGILQAAPALSLRLPHDLAVVTFSEQPSQYGIAPVTTMLIPAEELGRTAVEMLLQKISDPACALPPRPVPFLKFEYPNDCA
jgi:LacI family transcriptional regulator